MTQEEDIRRAVETMKAGGVILYPTDTVWGIGCDATNPEAVAKVYAIKQRSDSKAMICLVDSDARLQRYVRNVPEVAWQLIDCAERPLTVILDAAQNYRDIAPELLEAVDYVCWSRRQEHKPHKPSSIVRLKMNGEVDIIRK